jgi:hypothetical protein
MTKANNEQISWRMALTTIFSISGKSAPETFEYAKHENPRCHQVFVTLSGESLFRSPSCTVV